jgi:hypothetical protein
MRVVVASAALLGCSALSRPATPEAVASALDVIADIVRNETGKELDQVPTTCESEHHPDSGELLILCTVRYRSAVYVR